MSRTLHEPMLDIENLAVSYRAGNRWLDAVRDVTLRVMPGQTYGLVGESGSGKSTLALAIMRYLPENGVVRQGTIRLAGRDIQSLNQSELQDVWRNRLKLVPQNPLSSLNPSLRIGDQLAEALGGSFARQPTRDRVLELLSLVRIADPSRVAASYPHQLSGGMQQRVMIAMALGVTPSGERADLDFEAQGVDEGPWLMVLDEPTTNLDVTTEATILDLFGDLIRERNTAVLYVSHNLGVVTSICDRVAVLYAGELVEDAAVVDLYRKPLHPYAKGLLDSVPRVGQNKQRVSLRPIPGSIPQLDDLPQGCVFEPRCHVSIPECARERPALDLLPAEGRASRHGPRCVRCLRWTEILSGQVSLEPVGGDKEMVADRGWPEVELDGNVLQVDALEKLFPVRRTVGQVLRRRRPRQVRAVDGVSLRIGRARTVGLVGESGSGKTTLARCVVGLAERTSGEVTLLGVPLEPGLSERNREVLRRLQMVFQNPEEALNPYRTVGATLKRTLTQLAGVLPEQAEESVIRLLAAVGLGSGYVDRMPSQLSGGEKQRVAIARAFASQPELLIFDESVSALDVSVQATILNLLTQLQGEADSAYLFISHDLAVVGYLADDVIVMYLGKAMEVGSSEQIFSPPYHPYTEALLSSIPLLDPEAYQERIRLEGDIPSPIDVPSGCRFHTRCPRFLGAICINQEPPWQEGKSGHHIQCHISLDDLEQAQKPVFSIPEPPG